MLMLQIAGGIVLGAVILALLPVLGAALIGAPARLSDWWRGWECPRWVVITAIVLVVPTGRAIGTWAFNH